MSGINIMYEEYDLANGLHVILHQDRSLPIVAINLWYHVGSKNEHDGETGFAHLFEHMMFQGSENVPANMHFHHVQSAGGTLNASTSFDRTNYYETLPAHQLELGLWLESDRMNSLAVTEQTLETQRNVVMEERRSRYDNQPYGTMLMELFARAYKMQPYRWPTIGSMADIQSATLEQVRAFHRMYYRPENATLCLAGDFELSSAQALIEKYFASIRNNDGEMYRPFVHEPPQTTQVRDYVYDSIPLPGLVVGMHIPDMNAPDFIPLDILSYILTSGESSRFYRKFVYEARIAQSILSFAYDLELPGLFIFRLIAQQGKTPEMLESMLWKELDDVRRNGVTESELQKAKNRIETMFVRAVSSLQSRADLLNSFRVLAGDAALLNVHRERIHAVTREDVQRAAATYLTEHNATCLHYLPYPKKSSEQ
ncbi:MAG: insulinase family protein [Bacteroidetes bacterium]|nr:insulinase family protein [Bacteroidota bacterium]